MPCSRRRALAALAGLPLAACRAAPSPPRALALSPLLVRSPPPWRAGLGDLGDVDPALRPAFTDAHGFDPLPPPAPRGWRALRPEPPQTVADFRAAAPNTRAAPRDRIALLPLGRFPFDVVPDGRFVATVRAPEPSAIAGLLAAYFATPVDVLPALPFPAALVPRRVRAGRGQYDARALLGVVARRLPADAYAMLALVTVDLFVFADQDYAFGWSTLQQRLGAVGFSRLDPSVHGGAAPPEATLLRRGLHVAVHEVGHTFGLDHCQALRCAMNGVADVDELDATPLHLCPLCLRKLHLVTGLDPRARDAALQRAYAALGLADEARWLAGRSQRLWSAGDRHASASP
jgi:archaemetzincin